MHLISRTLATGRMIENDDDDGVTTTVRQHLMAFSFHPPFINIINQKKSKKIMTQTTKILNKTVENIVLSSVLESIKGIKGNKRFFKKLKTLSEKDKNKL